MEIFVLVIIGFLTMVVASSLCEGTEAPMEEERKGK
jgi:hypothetical protein